MRKIALVSMILVQASIVPTSPLFSQANTTLSNLNSPTAVNVDLTPITSNTRNLGSSSLNWNNFYFNGAIYKGSERFILATTPNANTVVGILAGASFTDQGIWNTAVGFAALQNNTTANENAAFGYAALRNTTSGFHNTAVGTLALNFNINGTHNTATGNRSLFFNTSGSENSAFGTSALNSNKTGSYNTAVGKESNYSNNAGSYNTSVGFKSLNSNIDGQRNTALGALSLVKSKGNNNAAVGAQALLNNSTGSQNVAVGVDALFGTTTQNRNTGIGYMAGANAATLGTFLGANTNASPGLTNVTAIGYGAFATSSNQVRIGDVNTTSIGGNANWTNFSDGRFKKDIKADVPGLEFINSLKPVTYKLDVAGIDRARRTLMPASKEDYEVSLPDMNKKSQIVYTGFVAQEVEKAAKELNYDFSGVDVPENDKGFYGLRYSDFVVPLTKAVQELSRKNDELENEIKELKEIIRRLDSRSNFPGKVSLGQNYPNPFSVSTVVQFEVPTQSSNAKLVVTNIQGQQLQVINIAKDMQQVTINAGALAAGTYHYSLWIDGQKVETRKMIIAR